MEARPWYELPSELSELLEPELAPLAAEIIGALGEAVPAYARPLEGPFGEGVRVGVEQALGQFVAEFGGTVQEQDPESRRIYVDLGRGEMRAGRTLEALLAAYRVGARLSWRRFAAAGVREGADPQTLYLLAESIFAYIDELSAESVEGYALEQSAATRATERRRRRLLGLLVQTPAADPPTIEAAALEAGWSLPRTLAAIAVEGEAREDLAAALAPVALIAPVDDLVCALLPDPQVPERLEELRGALARRLETGRERAQASGNQQARSAQAAIGPMVGWPDASVSFARARATLALAADGRVPGEPLLSADEHRAALLLGADERLVSDLADSALAPLRELTPAARARLLATLRSWLSHQGRLAPVAAELGVHPQTVRYRVAQLREHFGGALDDGERRFELELALRAAG